MDGCVYVCVLVEVGFVRLCSLCLGLCLLVVFACWLRVVASVELACLHCCCCRATLNTTRFESKFQSDCVHTRALVWFFVLN